MQSEPEVRAKARPLPAPVPESMGTVYQMLEDNHVTWLFEDLAKRHGLLPEMLGFNEIYRAKDGAVVSVQSPMPLDGSYASFAGALNPYYALIRFWRNLPNNRDGVKQLPEKLRFLYIIGLTGKVDNDLVRIGGRHYIGAIVDVSDLIHDAQNVINTHAPKDADDQIEFMGDDDGHLPRFLRLQQPFNFLYRIVSLRAFDSAAGNRKRQLHVANFTKVIQHYWALPVGHQNIDYQLTVTAEPTEQQGIGYNTCGDRVAYTLFHEGLLCHRPPEIKCIVLREQHRQHLKQAHSETTLFYSVIERMREARSHEAVQALLTEGRNQFLRLIFEHRNDRHRHRWMYEKSDPSFLANWRDDKINAIDDIIAKYQGGEHMQLADLTRLKETYPNVFKCASWNRSRVLQFMQTMVMIEMEAERHLGQINSDAETELPDDAASINNAFG